MTRQDNNPTNDQSKASTGKPSMPTVSDLTPRNELKGGVSLIAPAVQNARYAARSSTSTHSALGLFSVGLSAVEL